MSIPSKKSSLLESWAALYSTSLIRVLASCNKYLFFFSFQDNIVTCSQKPHNYLIYRYEDSSNNANGLHIKFSFH